MKKNVGNLDRIVRILLALVFIGLKLGGLVDGTIGLVLMILGFVFIGTALVGFCPLYLPFGLSTCNVENK